jgi:chemotaxis protein methyltransferase CheR
MQMNLSETQFVLFQTYIQQQCGILIGKDKNYLIESRLTKLLIDSGLRSFDELYTLLAHTRDDSIRDRVIDALTTNETSWFRDRAPWLLLKHKLLPKYIEELRARKVDKIRIWSAAASTGQEAYSIAMTIDRYLRDQMIRDITLDRFEILATDISQTVLDIAVRGRYDSISIMRGLSEDDKTTYFRRDGMVWEIDERIKSVVRFMRFNLQDSYILLGKFQLVFCRYVMIYFSDDLKRDIIGKLSRCLTDQGALMIGASELNTLIDRHFDLIDTEYGLYYLKKGERT